MITVENLTKSFQHTNGTVVALDDVSMQIPAGTVCGVVGPSGAGKSTLARCIGLLDTPDRGVIKVDGRDVTALQGKELRAAQRHISVVAQDDELVRQRTAAGNVALPLEAAGLSGSQRRSTVGELLDLVGLAGRASVHPDQLSAGQRQRIAIARALATQPSVLLVDDPTAGLDSEATGSVLTVLDRVRSELGVTVVVATNDMTVVRRIADDVVVLEDGRAVEHGKVLDLVAEPGSRLGTNLLPGVDQADYTRRGGHRPDVVAEVVLVGFAAVGALLPEAASRFGVELSILGGGLTRLGETPVAKFKIALSGERAESALKWMVERDAHVRRAPAGVQGAAA